MTQHSFVPTRAIPPLISRKKKSDDKSECPHCQKKARVSEPGDLLEHEADRAADAVMNRKPVPSLGSAGPQYQRRARDDSKAQKEKHEAHDEHDPHHKDHAHPQHAHQAMTAKPAHETATPSPVHQPAAAPAPAKKLDGTAPLQRKARQTDAQPNDSVFDALEDHGTSLDPATLHFMQERFGRDFSHVRIHTGIHGERAANAIQARAFTHGQHVVFGSGEYRPGTQSGRQLLAHELAHVAQQGAAPVRAQTPGPPVTQTPAGIAPPISVAPAATLARLQTPAKSTSIVINGIDELSALTVRVDPDKDKRDDGPFRLAFDVSMLMVPRSKGIDVEKTYNNLAKKRALAATIGDFDKDPKIVLKQARDSSEQLRDRWLDKVGWPRDEASALPNWADAGGNKTKFYVPLGQEAKCQTDHIVELQVGGNNTKENLRPLNGPMNELAGRTLWAELSTLAKAIRSEDQLGAKSASEIQLTFKNAVMGGKTVAGVGTETNPTCLGIHEKAFKPTKGKTVLTEGMEAYVIKTQGGRTATLRVDKGFSKAKPDKSIQLGSPGYDNAGAITFLPGFTLKTLTRGEGKDTLRAALDERKSTRLPLTFGDAQSKTGDAPFEFGVNLKSGLLTPFTPKTGKDQGIPIDYKFMSPGAITSLTLTDDGVDFKGYIKPSLPFLKKLDIKYEKEVLSISKDLVPADYKLPIPGAKVTKANIALILSPELKAEGTLGIEYSAGKRKIMEGELKATVDTAGLRLGGDLNVFIPGVDSATAHFEYTKEAGWSGHGKVGLADLQKKLKYVKSGEVGIGFTQGKGGEVDIEASGKVMLDIPSTQGVEVSLIKNKDGWKFKGKGTFDIPKMKPVDIAIEYDGEHLSGEAKGIGFKYKNFDATIDLRYKDEKFSGDGTVHFEKGRAKGVLKVHLLPTGRFTGEGSLTLAIREGIEATAGVSLDKDEKLHVDGKLAFAKPIKLFEGFKGDATILDVGVSIPIPGLSVGVVGVNARIEGKLEAGYQIGPGEIRNASAEAKFDPLEDDPNLSIEIKGQIWIGASAYIKGSISGLIEVSVGIASVSGGLKVSATATLSGEVLSNITLFYAKGRYEAKADFAASLALAIRLALEAVVKAEAGVGPFKVATERDWTLAAKEFNTGLTLGIKVTKPLSYSSDKGLDTPGPSDIEVTKPNLDPAKLIDNVMGASSPKDKPL
ncbi:uncharacterized protein DUF4157 [Luteibacter rhizovicinus]|uniref:Uncharacterized protein DUF4157 n=1 Tax=Luteibacter rhizovicinus TaxID=242606 RepID=A0A4R3YSH8_9GAMM|nr:DUF4157 domain-containing protein [Luteibacter rhizovicinus]TCV94658.1 uncharacterized protein DUF4157 [Luteibacter rhizovicinus]